MGHGSLALRTIAPRPFVALGLTAAFFLYIWNREMVIREYNYTYISNVCIDVSSDNTFASCKQM